MEAIVYIIHPLVHPFWLRGITNEVHLSYLKEIGKGGGGVNAGRFT